jgi:hypothetical protein
MKPIALSAAVFVILLMGVPALACLPQAFCNGVLTNANGWVMVGPESYCRLRVGTYGAKEVLKTCRVGVVCHAEIVGDDDACYVTRDLKKVPPDSRITHKNPDWGN